MRNARLLRLSKLRFAALGMVVSIAPSFAGDLVNTNVRNCTWCHGPSAQGYAPAPRLAGQQPLYIVRQLSSYRAHRRDNPFSKMYMWAAAANVESESARYLANYLASLAPRAANDGNPNLVADGRAIYQEGAPEANVAACVACHGPRGQGIAEIPRLGGLSYAYLQDRLQQWHDGYDAAAMHPMPHVAGNLSAEQIAALASYLSFLQ